jgi:hypothetical protein
MSLFWETDDNNVLKPEINQLTEKDMPERLRFLCPIFVAPVLRCLLQAHILFLIRGYI